MIEAYLESLDDLSVSACDIPKEAREALEYIVDRERRIQDIKDLLAVTKDTDEMLQYIKLLVAILEEDTTYE